MAKRILVINPFGIGDVLFSTPLVSALKEIYPKSYIGYICNKKTVDILETNPEIDEVFIFERGEYRALWKESKFACAGKFIGFWKRLASGRFDMVIDLSLGKEYAFLCRFIGIKERRGFNYRGRGRFLSHKVPFDGFNDKPVTEYYLDLLPKDVIARPKAEAISTVLIPTEEDIKYIDDFLNRIGVSDEDALIGMAPGGGMSFGTKDQDRRRWSAEKFSDLAEKIVDKIGAKVILVWGPGEEGLVDKIKRCAKNSVLISPETSVRQMAALFGKCRMVICSEGGPLHIAVSQGVKTISIFGPVDEKTHGPYPKSEKNIVLTSDISCRPCYRKFKLPECDTRKCLEDVSVDTVLERIKIGA